MTDRDYIRMKLDEKPTVAGWFSKLEITSNSKFRDALMLSLYFLLVPLLTTLLAVNVYAVIGFMIGYAMTGYGVMTALMINQEWARKEND